MTEQMIVASGFIGVCLFALGAWIAWYDADSFGDWDLGYGAVINTVVAESAFPLMLIGAVGMLVGIAGLEGVIFG